MLICGDFNFSEIVWEENVMKSGGQHPVDASNFFDVINDCFLYQHVLRSTHNLDQENESRLDLIFSRALMCVENIQTLALLGKSHHATLFSDFLIDEEVQLTSDCGKFKYCFDKGNYEEIRKKNYLKWIGNRFFMVKHCQRNMRFLSRFALS